MFTQAHRFLFMCCHFVADTVKSNPAGGSRF